MLNKAAMPTAPKTAPATTPLASHPPPRVRLARVTAKKTKKISAKVPISAKVLAAEPIDEERDHASRRCVGIRRVSPVEEGNDEQDPRDHAGKRRPPASRRSISDHVLSPSGQAHMGATAPGPAK